MVGLELNLVPELLDESYHAISCGHGILFTKLTLLLIKADEESHGGEAEEEVQVLVLKDHLGGKPIFTIKSKQSKDEDLIHLILYFEES